MPWTGGYWACNIWCNTYQVTYAPFFMSNTVFLRQCWSAVILLAYSESALRLFAVHCWSFAQSTLPLVGIHLASTGIPLIGSVWQCLVVSAHRVAIYGYLLSDARLLPQAHLLMMGLSYLLGTKIKMGHHSVITNATVYIMCVLLTLVSQSQFYLQSNDFNLTYEFSTSQNECETKEKIS